MKAIILAAGRGTRMKDLTDTTPKPMLIYKGKNLIQHKLDILSKEIDEVIIVIGYLGDSIKDFFGNQYKDKKITYVQMENLNGTGSAVHLCKQALGNNKEKFLVMMGDDIYDREDVCEMIKHDWAILVKKVDTQPLEGNILINEKGNFIGIGSDESLPGGLLYTGMCVIGPEFFDYDLVKPQGKQEWGLPHTVAMMTKDFDIKVLYTEKWIQISSPEDLV